MVIVGPLISAIIAGGTTPSNSSSMADSDCSIFPNVSTAIPSSLTAFELHSQLSYFKAVVGTDNLPNLESILSASRDRQVELIDDSFEHDDEIDDLENEVQLLEELLDDAKIKYKDASQRAKDANTPENIQEMQKREWMVSNAKEELSEAENLKFAYEHDRDWCWAQHREEEMKSERIERLQALEKEFNARHAAELAVKRAQNTKLTKKTQVPTKAVPGGTFALPLRQATNNNNNKTSISKNAAPGNTFSLPLHPVTAANTGAANKVTKPAHGATTTTNQNKRMNKTANKKNNNSNKSLAAAFASHPHITAAMLATLEEEVDWDLDSNFTLDAGLAGYDAYGSRHGHDAPAKASDKVLAFDGWHALDMLL